MDSPAYDLIVLGGGPAGSAAALRAAEHGLRAALVESGFLGGACLNSGCVPTKYLLGASAALPLLREQQRRKAAHGDARLDFATLQAHKDRYVRGTRKALQKKLEKAGVSLLKGKAAFSGPRSVLVREASGEREYTFAKCVAAIGSVPASYPELAPDGATVYSPAGILNLRKIPESLIIVGGGAIGLELGELLHRFGCAITLAEASERLLQREDPDVGRTLSAHYRRQGWDIRGGRRILSVTTRAGRSVLRFADGEELSAAASLLCIGRKPSLAALAPQAAGLAVNARGWLETDEHLRCSEHVYAVGDVNGRMLIANAAAHQARYAADHAAGRESGPYRAGNVPFCIHGGLEFMRVGPSAEELLQSGGAVACSRAELAANPAVQGSGRIPGFVKMFWTDGRLRSVLAVGHDASRLLAPASLLISAGVKKNLTPPLFCACPALDEVLETAILEPAKNIADDAC